MSTYTNYGTVNDASNQTGTKFSVIEYLKNRCLGEVDLSVYDKTGGNTFSNQRQMPTEGYVANFAIESTGSLFQIGNTYETVLIQPSPLPAPQLPGSGLKIMCTDTISEGTIVGALSEFKVVDWGSFDYVTSSLTVTNPAASSNDATIGIILAADKLLTSIFKDKCDGKRYFPPGKGYSGPTLSTQNINLTENPSTNFIFFDLNPNYTQRTSLVNLELEAGLTTPENVSEILTEQLRTPKYFNDSYNKSNDYFNYSEDNRYWTQPTRESNKGGLITRRPAALESQTYILNNCNFAPETSPNSDTYSLQGVRKRFYSNVAYQNPDKIQGLNCFRNFIYSNNNDSMVNEINSGKFQSADENQGDFQSQRLGNLGLNPCILRYWSNTIDDVSIPMKKNDLLLTNIYYTEENIKKIAAGFRSNERYFGDLTKQFDPTSLSQGTLPSHPPWYNSTLTNSYTSNLKVP